MIFAIAAGMKRTCCLSQLKSSVLGREAPQVGMLNFDSNSFISVRPLAPRGGRRTFSRFEPNWTRNFYFFALAAAAFCAACGPFAACVAREPAGSVPFKHASGHGHSEAASQFASEADKVFQEIIFVLEGDLHRQHFAAE